jgi:hypothetical protein
MQTEEREVLFAAIVFNWRRENSYPWIARKTKFGIEIEIEQNNGTLSSLTTPLFLENLCSFASYSSYQIRNSYFGNPDWNS